MRLHVAHNNPILSGARVPLIERHLVRFEFSACDRHPQLMMYAIRSSNTIYNYIQNSVI